MDVSTFWINLPNMGEKKMSNPRYEVKTCAFGWYVIDRDDGRALCLCSLKSDAFLLQLVMEKHSGRTVKK